MRRSSSRARSGSLSSSLSSLQIGPQGAARRSRSRSRSRSRTRSRRTSQSRTRIRSRSTSQSRNASESGGGVETSKIPGVAKVKSICNIGENTMFSFDDLLRFAQHLVHTETLVESPTKPLRDMTRRQLCSRISAALAIPIPGSRAFLQTIFPCSMISRTCPSG